MQIREISPQIGDEVTLCNSYNSYFLPEGVRPGKAKLISPHYGGITVEQDGRTWRLSDRCLEYQFEYKVGHKWYPADHPLVAQEAAREEALRQALATEPEVTELLR